MFIETSRIAGFEITKEELAETPEVQALIAEAVAARTATLERQLAEARQERQVTYDRKQRETLERIERFNALPEDITVAEAKQRVVGQKFDGTQWFRWEGGRWVAAGAVQPDRVGAGQSSAW